MSAVLDYLKEKDVLHEVTEHKAVYNMEEVSQIDIPYPEAVSEKSFCTRDDKKRNYYLITVKGVKRLIKGVRRKIILVL